MLPQTTGADLAFPFWSADGREIVFRSGTELKRIQVADGSTETIADGITRFRRGAWSSAGTVLFATDVIHRLSPPGVEPVALTTLDRSLGEAAHAAPSFLPDQRHFLYKAATWNRRNGTIYIGSIDASEPRKRLLEASRAIYVEPGYVLFAREEKLFARAFDAKRLEFTGEPVLIADDVMYSDSLDTSAFDASNDGTLIMRRRVPAGPDLPLVWTDRSGSTRTPVDLKLSPIDFRLSADGERIVYSEGDPPDVWVLDVTRGSRARLTADAETDHNAVWSPDGEWIAFDSHRGESHGIYRKRADGAVPEELLYDAGQYEVEVTDWSADGRFIVFHQDSMCLGCNYDVWVLPTFGERKPIQYTARQLRGALRRAVAGRPLARVHDQRVGHLSSRRAAVPGPVAGQVADLGRRRHDLALGARRARALLHRCRRVDRPRTDHGRARVRRWGTDPRRRGSGTRTLGCAARRRAAAEDGAGAAALEHGRERVRVSDHRDPELACSARESMIGYSSQRQSRFDRRPIGSVQTRSPRSH